MNLIGFSNWQEIVVRGKLEYAEHVRNNISIQKLATRDFWRTANSVLNNNKSAIPPLFQGPFVASSPKDKTDVFAQQFAANSTLDDNGRSPPDFPLWTHTSIKLPVITPRKVAGIIINLDINKDSGLDRIPVIVLKKCCPSVSSVLARLFNSCLAECIFLSSWKLAHVVPVFKGVGDKSQPSNYRSISLICCWKGIWVYVSSISLCLGILSPTVY